MSRRRVLVVLVLALVAVAAACGGGGGGGAGVTTGAGASPQGEPAGGDLSGTWLGQFSETSPGTEEGEIEIAWSQAGSQLTGTVVLRFSACFSVAEIAGTVTGTLVEFGRDEGDIDLAYQGTVTGDEMFGTYVSVSCGTGGTWEATRQ